MTARRFFLTDGTALQPQDPSAPDLPSLETTLPVLRASLARGALLDAWRALEGRPGPAAEALRYGFVNRVEDTHADALAAAEVMAREICAKSPLAITGIKQVLNYGREHSIADGLEYVAVWNAGMLQGEDMKEAVKAQMARLSAS